ncbi:MAG: hypothetical protein M1133_00345 [Armatimonadetes bacterium]|nr:hypothetical protein [Armatimonadota bacterium]
MTEALRSMTLDAGQARKVVLSTIHEIGKEQAGIINACRRTLAEPIRAEDDMPPRGVAGAGGFAVISRNTLGASENDPKRLSVLAESVSRETRLVSGTVVAVRKGDILPLDADAVLGVRGVFRPRNDPEVLVRAEVKPGDNVRSAGCDISKGELLIESGTVITGREMGLLATIGRHGITISRRPKVSVITSGSGVVDVLENLRPGEEHNSARYSLVGFLIEAGCELDRLIHIKEGRVGLERALAGCASSDATIVTLGPEDKHDLAVTALENCGNVHFSKLNIEPGMATAFGTVEGKPVFITSAEAILEVFEALIRPGLLSMLGRAEIDRLRVNASMQTMLKLNPGYRHYIKAITHFHEDGCATQPIGPYSPTTRPWAIPNSLIVVSENVSGVARGEKVDVCLLG